MLSVRHVCAQIPSVLNAANCCFLPVHRLMSKSGTPRASGNRPRSSRALPCILNLKPTAPPSPTSPSALRRLADHLPAKNISLSSSVLLSPNQNLSKRTSTLQGVCMLSTSSLPHQSWTPDSLSARLCAHSFHHDAAVARCVFVHARSTSAPVAFRVSSKPLPLHQRLQSLNEGCIISLRGGSQQ